MVFLTTLARLVLGGLVVAFWTAVFVPVLLVCLPSRRLRIRIGNVYGHAVGRSVLWVTGARYDVSSAEETAALRPAIYVSNHVSTLDIFLGIWLAPTNTCGVGKKEVVWYPFFGQLYWISGHLRLDRGNRARAVEALADTAVLMRRWGLGAWIWPEGTRSRDGRLLAFKKGFAHLALATRLPIVPVVVEGAQRVWPRSRFAIVPGDVSVRVMPPIPTDDWSLETLDAHIAQVRQVFLDALPEEQRPLEVAAAK